MVVAYIEIERDPNWVGKGDITIIPTSEHCAILHGHNWSGGGIDRTVFKVNTSQSNIDKVIASHKDVRVYTTVEEMQLRGLEIRPGTPTDLEVDSLTAGLKKDFNIDLNNITNTTASKSWADYLKQDCESIGIGKIKCTNCGTINESSTSIVGNCSSCGQDLNKVGKYHSNPFDIGSWANPTVNKMV